MIEQIANHFAAKLSAYVEKFIPLAELKTDGDKTFPVAYSGKGNYSKINLDNSNGLAYLRVNADPFASEQPQDMNPCKIEMLITYPVRLVYCIPRLKMASDDCFAATNLAGDLIREITQRNGSLKTSLKAITASVFPSGWTTDTIQVWNEEYSGIPQPDINYRMLYGAINFNVTIQINSACIPDSCAATC